MNPFANIFDAELVQLKTRRTVLNLSASICVAIVVAASIGFGAKYQDMLSPLEGAAIILSTIIYVIWALDRLQRARSVAWCLKITDDAIVGYDFSRQRRVIFWRDVTSIDVTESALHIHSSRRSSLVIPHLYKEYEALGHVLLDYTESYGVLLTVNGTPMNEINVYQLFPGFESYTEAA